MGDARHAGLSPALVETVAGLSAGSVATLIVHPLDVVKTRMQIYRSVAAPSAPPPSTVAIVKTLLNTPHPVAALYRGLTPNLLGNATSWASFFFFKSRIEGLVVSLKTTAPADVSQNGAPSTALLTPTDFFISSGLAGACVQVITNPIWVLKTRMLSSDRSARGAYPSMWAGAAHIIRDEGVLGFYRGLGVSLIGVSHGAVQFAVYEPVKRMYLTRRGQHQQRQDQAAAGQGSAATGRPSMSNEATLVISTASKLIAGTVTYPYQVVRSRLQNYDAEARFGRGILGVSARLWREDGIRGFYRGLVPGVIRVLPATWVTFLVYENVKFYLPRWAV